MSENQGKKAAVYGEAARQGYEGSVLARMAGRSGAYSPKGAPGIAFEVMANDKANLKHILEPGVVTEMTKSPVAPQLDAITKKGGKIMERIQYKDTPSASGIQKTLKQVQQGKYQQAQLRGTTETAREFNRLAPKKGITKHMESTGISSKMTKRIGNKFTGQMPELSGIGKVSGKSAAFGAGITAATEVVKSVVNGDSVGECAGHVVSKSAESAIAAGVSSAAAEVVFGVAGPMFAASAAPVLAPVLLAGGAALAAGALVGELTDGAFDGIGDGVSDVVDGIGDGLYDVAEGIADGAGEIADSVIDTVGDMLDGVGSFFDGLFCW